MIFFLNYKKCVHCNYFAPKKYQFLCVYIDIDIDAIEWNVRYYDV